MSSLTQTESPPLEAALAKQIASLASVIIENHNHCCTRLRTSEEKNTSLANDIRSFATRLCAFKEKNTVLEKKNAVLEKDIDSLATRLRTSEEKNADLEKKNAALAKDIDSLATRLRTSEEKNTALEKNIEYLLSRVHNHEQKTADFAVSTLEEIKSLDHTATVQTSIDMYQGTIAALKEKNALLEELATRIQKLEDKNANEE